MTEQQQTLRRIAETSTTAEETTTEAAITVQGLHQRYGDFEAVRGVSFEVRRGELFALLGTNGAGKTTTIEVLEGFRAPASGTVRVLGLDPYADRAKLRARTGIMLQEGGFIGDLTVAETVRFWRETLPDRPQTVDQALARVDLTDKAKVPVRQLSGGQKRRLDLALATLARPEVLFLDEPTTGMDPEARRNTWTTIQELVEDGTTVVLTTHYLEEAERLADRIAIMHAGLIAVSGTIASVVAERGSRVRFVAPPGVRLPALDGIDAVVAEGLAEYHLGGDRAAAQRRLRQLLDWADGDRLVLDRFEVRGASLEDVFLEIAHAA